MVDRFARDWRTAGLDEATFALLELAEKLTERPASCSSSDTDGLRRHGWDDQGISSAVQVIAYFNYINRIADGLGVALEDFIAPDGRKRSD